MYASSVLSCTIAPSGQAVATSAARRMTSSGRATSGHEAEFGRGERDAVVAVSQGVGGRIERDPEVVPRRGIGGSSPGKRGDANEQLGESERFRQVVVATRMKATHAIRKRGARRQEEHRTGHAVCPERHADVAAVGVGKPDVEDQHVRRRVREHPQGVGAGRCRPDLVALAVERAANHAAQFVVVFAQPDCQGHDAARV